MRILIVLLLLATAVFAQNRVVRPVLPGQEEVNETLPVNYLLKLAIVEKEQQIGEIQVIVASTQFRVDAVEPSVTFTGSLQPQESGSVLLRYSLGAQISSAGPQGNNVQYATSSAQTSVRLQLAEPVDILKSGSRTYRLTVSKAETKAGK